MSTRRARLDRADGALLRPGSDMAWPPTPEEFGRLRETLAWVAARSSYYRRVFDAIRELMAPPRRTARRLGFRVWAQTS